MWHGFVFFPRFHDDVRVFSALLYASAEEVADDRLVAEAKTRYLRPPRCSYRHRDGKGRIFDFQAAQNSVQEIQVQ